MTCFLPPASRANRICFREIYLQTHDWVEQSDFLRSSSYLSHSIKKYVSSFQVSAEHNNLFIYSQLAVIS